MVESRMVPSSVGPYVIYMLWYVTCSVLTTHPAPQAVLAPNYLLYKDLKDGAAFTVPQGTEIEVYRKVCSIFASIFDQRHGVMLASARDPEWCLTIV